MKRAIVVGSGAGGATAARELAGRFDVTVLEAGGGFRPFTTAMPALEWLKSSRLLFDERQIPLFFPSMRVQRADGIVMVRGVGAGGSTPMSMGSAIRADAGLKAIGLNLDAEFDEIAREIPSSTDHARQWLPSTRRLFEVCREMGLEPEPTPKMLDPARCKLCGRCVFGCVREAKWDSRRFLSDAQQKGARVITGCRVDCVQIEGGAATGVHTSCGLIRRFIPADIVILAAGGLGTPLILERSGIAAEPALFVQPVQCVAAKWSDAMQCFEMPMPFGAKRDGFLIAPYFDLLSFFFNRRWKPAARHTLVMMVALADASQGVVSKHAVKKELTASDRRTLDAGTAVAREALERFGAKTTFLGTMQAGHPGGSLPLTSANVHPPQLPANVWVADASLLPEAPGAPPMLTIIALAKRVARMV
ncbi:MAG TPA: GMC family oxidoreductase N-terminal domain-containing protein [Bryobacteraceae bacterium]|nr:GMC family oxidoreductase N-terminal domain-containing protein [Bryobacteraceae bacterium]